MDQLLPADAPVETHTDLSKEQSSLSITLALMSPPSAEDQPLIKSTALIRKPGKQGFPLQLADKSLTTAMGLSINNEMNLFLQSRAMGQSTAPEDKEKSSLSSVHLPGVMSDLVSTETTEMAASNHSDKHMVNEQGKPLDSASTTPFPIEISSEDEKPAWHREVTTPVFKFSTQSMLKSEGIPILDIKGNLQSSSARDSTHLFDEMESYTVSSEGAESSTFKLTPVEQIKTKQGSILFTMESTLNTFSAEPDFMPHLQTDATSWHSDTIKQLSTYLWSSNSIESFSSSGDTFFTTLPSTADNWQSPDISEAEYSAASVATSWLLDVSEGEYSTAASSVATTWLLDVSEGEYSTAASSVATTWLPDVSEGEYSTAASSVATTWLPDVSEGEYITSTATNWPFNSSEAEFSMAMPHMQLTVLEEEFSISDEPPSSPEEYFSTTSFTTNLLPNASKALPSAPTNWKPNLFEKLSTSLDSTSHQDPFTSSPTNNIYLKPNVSEVQPFTMTTSVGIKSEATSFTIQSSKTMSPLPQIGQSASSVIYNRFLLQFGILGLSYTDSLSNSSSKAYQELEMVVRETLDAIFYARYGDSFLRTKILSFVNGSIKVESEVVFQEHAALPSSSDVVRTVLTHVYHKDLVPTDLVINASSVVCNA
ncbi:mucin-1-like [Heptranchias perlo]|uniref:mucin-1-like n=1 Tax=Heptranchias perlo TaxID=212740 RepID=UPI00355A844D